VAKCTQCKQEVSIWSRDLLTGTCPECRASWSRDPLTGTCPNSWSRDPLTGTWTERRASGALPATLGAGTLGLSCGTALLIWIIVAIFSRPGPGSFEPPVDKLNELKRTGAQANEIRELLKVMEEQRKGATGKDK
jgi:hypothetical protein